MRVPLLLLFVSRLCLGKPFPTYHEVEYGSTYRFYIPDEAQSVEFTRLYDLEKRVVWKRDEPQSTEGTRWRVTGSYFSIINATSTESGHYMVINRRNRQISVRSITVTAPVLEISLKTGERLHFSANVDEKSCNIFFQPDSKSVIEVVVRGDQRHHFNDTVCQGLYFTPPCQLQNAEVSASCNGHYKIKDNNKGVALKVNVAIQSYYAVYFAIGGLILCVILISCCVTRWCCRGSSSKPKASQPVLRSHHQYENEPLGGRLNPLSEPSRTPGESSRTTTGPLVSPLTHCVAVDPLCSDPEPRFELKGLNFNFASPLASDSTHSHVYTSEKLNFL